MSTHDYSRFFEHPHYAVMRHMPADSGGNVKEEGFNVCKENAKTLLETIGTGRVFHIYHSEIKRAAVTAETVATALKELGQNVEIVQALPWLKVDSRGLTNDKVRTVCKDNPAFFTLFITHGPELERFFNFEPSLYTCTIMSMEFVITGRRDG